MANTEKTYHRGSDERYDDTGRSSSRMKVVVRIRPETESEIHTAYPIVVKAVDDHVLVFDPRPDNTPTVGYSCVGEGNKFKKPSLPSKKHKDLRLGFDRVFDGTGTQIELFEHTTKDVVNDLLDGINCSVFAYGATGAGKTYTMLGDAASPGVMFYTMLELYKKINELKDEKICEVGLSYLEVRLPVGGMSAQHQELGHTHSHTYSHLLMDIQIHVHTHTVTLICTHYFSSGVWYAHSNSVPNPSWCFLY